MQKSKRHNKFSRKNKKNTRKNKQLRKKIKGGGSVNINYVFIGWYYNSCNYVHDFDTIWHVDGNDENEDIPPIPIVVPSNITDIQTYFNFCGIGENKNKHLIIPQLYELGIRNLNLFSLLMSNILFYDYKNEILEPIYYTTIQHKNKKYWTCYPPYLKKAYNESILDGEDLTISNHKFMEIMGLWLREKDSNGTPRSQKIREIELKYPRFFERMFISEEEEEHAIHNITKKGEPNISSNVQYMLQDTLQQIQREKEKALSEIQKQKETNNNFENLRKVISQIPSYKK